MSVRLQPDRLRFEMARRGLSATELARVAKLSHPTVSAALAGRPISATSLQLIAAALARLPVVHMIDALLGNDDRDIGLS
jgi:transcriptional regulator with XRE-family HTH domain